ncbi:MAG: hypothetical protein ACFFDN_47630 [Candidatus Hodarchaeota archaeon]
MMLTFKIFHYRKKVFRFYEYYIDLINIFILRLLKEKGYEIKSNLITDVNTKSISDLNISNLKKYAKNFSNGKIYTFDFIIVCLFLLIITVFFIYFELYSYLYLIAIGFIITIIIGSINFNKKKTI